jgi:hypothetical protein
LNFATVALIQPISSKNIPESVPSVSDKELNHKDIFTFCNIVHVRLEIHVDFIKKEVNQIKVSLKIIIKLSTFHKLTKTTPANETNGKNPQ